MSVATCGIAVAACFFMACHGVHEPPPVGTGSSGPGDAGADASAVAKSSPPPDGPPAIDRSKASCDSPYGTEIAFRTADELLEAMQGRWVRCDGWASPRHLAPTEEDVWFGFEIEGDRFYRSFEGWERSEDPNQVGTVTVTRPAAEFQIEIELDAGGYLFDWIGITDNGQLWWSGFAGEVRFAAAP